MAPQRAGCRWNQADSSRNRALSAVVHGCHESAVPCVHHLTSTSHGLHGRRPGSSRTGSRTRHLPPCDDVSCHRASAGHTLGTPSQHRHHHHEHHHFTSFHEYFSLPFNFIPISQVHHHWQDEVFSESVVRGHSFTVCDTVRAIPHSHTTTVPKLENVQQSYRPADPRQIATDNSVNLTFDLLMSGSTQAEDLP